METVNKEEVESGSKSTAFMTFALIAFFWTATMIFFGFGANRWVKDDTLRLTLTQARSFFRLIVDTRSWNASHGGLYAPVTPDTPPNPYLDVPDRDVSTQNGRELTLINPAYMTRQIAEIGFKKSGVLFHITSQRPIRPANRPLTWEKRALRAFAEKSDEYYEWSLPKDGKKEFRYMAPLLTEEACLACHAKQGYKRGDIRGGISVSIPADTILSTRSGTLRKLDLVFLGIWILGILFIYVSYKRTSRDLAKRESLIVRLRAALGEIKALHGILPICSSCKKIRTKSGSWERLEKYLSEHSDAQFSHGMCPDCMREIYPDYVKKVGGD